MGVECPLDRIQELGLGVECPLDGRQELCLGVECPLDRRQELGLGVECPLDLVIAIPDDTLCVSVKSTSSEHRVKLPQGQPRSYSVSCYLLTGPLI